MTSLPLEPLDVRAIPPAVRHATIFGILERLPSGAAFSIVNDHDPAPLWRQIEARYPGAYSWTYIVQGPEIWQVEIGRGDAAVCGGHDEGAACTCGH
ncbi:DUF2249 domain-containing protein [Bosea lathyri]|uniref:Uncharacterized conserved protein, DUF2249 family n=1 Tax=Bosea lathyri TaxID=1036778 RepID=A0A1H6AQ89_9HYPH|nr:DUF2249 domain-containing protein [Bosea lathyri]SEG49946.1 Uncharacterized conserved protein, DUF2249 family [Bosea lathyri]